MYKKIRDYECWCLVCVCVCVCVRVCVCGTIGGVCVVVI